MNQSIDSYPGDEIVPNPLIQLQYSLDIAAEPAEVQAQGVLLAEKAFQPQPFFDEVVSLLPGLLPEGKMVEESFEWLA